MKRARKMITALLGTAIMVAMALNFNACTNQSPLGLDYQDTKLEPEKTPANIQFPHDTYQDDDE